MNKPRLGAWALIGVLMVILAAACVFAYQGLTVDSDFVMPLSGYVAMGLGVGISLAVGIGLMFLLFYSSRAGYDAPAQVEPERPDDDQRRSDEPRQAVNTSRK
jgi:hypothetical protein